jgi:NADH-quinone oxidoreductase subunit L
VIGNFAAKTITTGALFTAMRAQLADLHRFSKRHSEKADVVPVLDMGPVGRYDVDWELRVDTLTAVMLVVVTSVSSARPSV